MHALFKNIVLRFFKGSRDKGGINMENIKKHKDFDRHVMIMIIIMIWLEERYGKYIHWSCQYHGNWAWS